MQWGALDQSPLGLTIDSTETEDEPFMQKEGTLNDQKLHN